MQTHFDGTIHNALSQGTEHLLAASAAGHPPAASYRRMGAARIT